MREYKVISPFVERDEKGNPTGNRPQIGNIVSLSAKEAERLKGAHCVIEVEQEIQHIPENRGRRGRPPRVKTGQ